MVNKFKEFIEGKSEFVYEFVDNDIEYLDEIFEIQKINKLKNDAFVKIAFETDTETTAKTPEEYGKLIRKNWGHNIDGFLKNEFLIIYGKMKNNHYEIHFWDTVRKVKDDNVKKDKFTSVFSIILSVVYQEHILRGRAELHIVFSSMQRGRLYKKIIDKMLEIYEVPYEVIVDKTLIIRPIQKEFNECTKLK